MEAIRYGTVTGVPKPILERTKNEVFIGGVLFNGSTEIHRCFIKKVQIELITVEYLLASLAALNKLHTITPIIINWNGTVCFGSFDEDCPNLSTVVTNYENQINFQENRKMLNWFLTWNQAHLAIAFDELISNPDRNTQNFLMKGENKILLIDHEGALASDSSSPTHENQLLNGHKSEVQPGDELGKKRLLRDIEKQVAKIKYSTIPHVLNLLVNDNLLTITESDEKQEYFKTRLHNISRFIEMQLDMKQTGFNYNG